jgi:XTP/dITP diphosphohydrolase
MKRLVLASSNAGKLVELQPLLANAGYELLTQGELGISDAIEDGHSFIENALLKARHACRGSGLPALADDSGIVVDALDGAPGLLSARYAGVHGDAAGNNRKLLAELQGVPESKRSARFVAVIVLLRHAEDPLPLVAQGVWEGRVLSAPRGDKGFGYDPLFFDPLLGHGAAELAPELKNQVSHRGKALQALKQLLAC